MELVETGKPSSHYTDRIAKIVEKYRNLPRFKREYMDAMQTEVIYAQMEEEALNRGMERGLAQGLEQGIERGLKQGMEQGIA